MSTPNIEDFRNEYGKLNLSTHELSEAESQPSPTEELTPTLRREDGRLYISPTPRHLFEFGPRRTPQDSDLRAFLGRSATFR